MGVNVGNLIQSGKVVGVGKMGQLSAPVNTESRTNTSAPQYKLHGSECRNVTTSVNILKPVMYSRNSVHTAQKMRSVSTANTSSAHYRYL